MIFFLKMVNWLRRSSIAFATIWLAQDQISAHFMKPFNEQEIVLKITDNTVPGSDYFIILRYPTTCLIDYNIYYLQCFITSEKLPFIIIRKNEALSSWHISLIAFILLYQVIGCNNVRLKWFLENNKLLLGNDMVLENVISKSHYHYGCLKRQIIRYISKYFQNVWRW